MRSRTQIRAAFGAATAAEAGLVALIIVGGIAGCDDALVQLSAADGCAPQIARYQGVLAGAFDTSVGAIRRFEAAPVDQQRWPGLPDAFPALLCFIDGDMRKILGGGDAAFDRAVVGVVNGAGQMVMAGFQDQILVRAP